MLRHELHAELVAMSEAGVQPLQKHQSSHGMVVAVSRNIDDDGAFEET